MVGVSGRFVGGGVAASTLGARAEQPEKIRKIGVLMNLSSEDPEGQARVKAYAQAPQKLGWIEGSNMRTEIRWAADDADRYRRYSEELLWRQTSSSPVTVSAWLHCSGSLTVYRAPI